MKKQNVKPKPKDKYIGLWVSPEFHERVAKAAERDRRSIASLVYLLIEKGLGRQASA